MRWQLLSSLPVLCRRGVVRRHSVITLGEVASLTKALIGPAWQWSPVLGAVLGCWELLW